MSSFLTYLATPSIKLATEKPTFGKPYVRIGKLFNIVGYWVYQQGGLLGYTLKEQPKLLVKLIEPQAPSIVPEQVMMKELIGIKEVIAKELESVKGEDNTFFNLYTVRELHQAGIELIKFPPDKNLDKKVDFESAGQIMRLAFIKGVAFGFHFPEQFIACWNNSYKAVDEKEWSDARNHGLNLPEKQPTLTFDQATHDLCDGILTWSNTEPVRVINDSDIQILQAILSVHKEQQ
jgi:hypothetical protein